MKAAIIILCYNGVRYLPAMLGSCQKYAPRVPVYLVDNASSDGTLPYVTNNWPKVKLLRQTANLGFAAGNNVGIKQAIADGTEAVFLLNQDAELTRGSLDKLVNYLSLHPRLALVQPRVNLPDGRVNSLGNCYHYLGFGFAGGNGLSYEEALRRLPWFKRQSEIPYGSGAAVLLRVQALQAVGLFDEHLFMYHEDLELGLRLRCYGWQLQVVPEAEVIHHYQFAANPNSFYFMERNRLVVWLSYFKLPTLLLLLIPFILSEVALLVSSLLSGWLGAWWRSRAYFFKVEAWRYLVQKRKQVRKFKQVSDRYLLSFATGSIHFQEHNPWYVSYLFNPLANLGWLVLKPLIRW